MPWFCLTRMDQFWDAAQAEAAVKCSEDVVAFVDEGLEMNEKILRMEAVHDAGYLVAGAKARLEKMLHDVEDIPIALNNEEMDCTNASVAFFRKEFCKAAPDIGRSVSACTVYYYNWKKSEKYKRVKQELLAEADYCAVCDDGGKLIVCDHCHNAYHFECHRPSLTKVPSGEWHCTQCLKSPAKT